MKKKSIYIFISFAILLILALFSLCIGRYNISVSEVLLSLCGKGDSSIDLVVYKLRLPRVICSVLIGGALAAAGMCFQGLFQNPLISPDILGVSSGACVGAVTSILLGLGTSITMIFAFSTGILSVAIAIFLAILTKKKQKYCNGFCRYHRWSLYEFHCRYFDFFSR